MGILKFSRPFVWGSLQTFLEDKVFCTVSQFNVCTVNSSNLKSGLPVKMILTILTCSLLGTDSWTLQVGGLDEDGGGVQSVRRKSVKAVLRQTGRDGDLMLSFTGGCKRKETVLFHQTPQTY